MSIDTPAHPKTAPTLDAVLSRDDLLDALAFTGTTISTRTPVPILAGVRLDAFNDQITLSTTDFEGWSWQTIAAPGASGSVVVSHAALTKIVKGLPKASHVVTLKVAGSHVTVSDGQTTFKVPALDLDAFPSRPDKALFKVVEMAGPDFHDAVTRVGIAASHDDTLPLLMNIQFKVAFDEVTMYATDRFRLTSYLIGQRSQTTRSPLLPAKLLKAAAAFFKTSGTVTLRSDEHRRDTNVGFYSTLSDSRRGITVRETEGDYPPVARLFPDQVHTTVDLDTTDTLAALKQVDVALGRGVPVRLDLSGPAVVMTADDGDMSASRPLKVAAEHDDTSEVDAVAFNPKFFTDALKTCGDTVHMAVNLKKSPVLFTTTDAPQFRHLVVPIRFAS